MIIAAENIRLTMIPVNRSGVIILTITA